MRDRLWWEGLVMTQRCETFVTPVWCQAGRKLNRSPNHSTMWSAWRAVLVGMIVAYLGWSLAGVLRNGMDDVRKSLGTASVSHEEPRANG